MKEGKFNYIHEIIQAFIYVLLVWSFKTIVVYVSIFFELGYCKIQDAKDDHTPFVNKYYSKKSIIIHTV